MKRITTITLAILCVLSPMLNAQDSRIGHLNKSIRSIAQALRPTKWGIIGMAAFSPVVANMCIKQQQQSNWSDKFVGNSTPTIDKEQATGCGLVFGLIAATRLGFKNPVKTRVLPLAIAATAGSWTIEQLRHGKQPSSIVSQMYRTCTNAYENTKSFFSSLRKS